MSISGVFPAGESGVLSGFGWVVLMVVLAWTEPARHSHLLVEDEGVMVLNLMVADAGRVVCKMRVVDGDTGRVVTWHDTPCTGCMNSTPLPEANWEAMGR